MQAEQLSQLPGWAQGALTLFAGLGIMWGLAKRYAKGEEAKAPTGDHMVLSATLADGHALRNLVDEIRDLRSAMQDSADQRHRDSMAMVDSNERLCRAMQDNTEAKRAIGVTPDMLALLARLGN